MQKAPGSCAFAEWLGCGFENCGSYDDHGARGRADVARVVGRYVVDGAGRAVVEPQQKRWRLGGLVLTTRAAIRSAGIAHPRILGEPLVRRPTQRTSCAAEEYRGGVEGCTVSLYAGGNGPPCLGAANHHYTH